MGAGCADRRLGETGGWGGEAGEALYAERQETDGGRAADDPLRGQPAGTAGIGDAGRVEPGGDEEAGELRRLGENEIAVRGEAFGSVEELADFGGLERRRAVQRGAHQRLELVPILRQQLEGEIVRDAVDPPWLGDRLETTHEEAADLLLVVDEPVGIAHH